MAECVQCDRNFSSSGSISDRVDPSQSFGNSQLAEFFGFFHSFKYDYWRQKVQSQSNRTRYFAAGICGTAHPFCISLRCCRCPLLRRGAYFPESVRTQLEADASRFIHNPDKVRYDAQKKTLYLSKIFKWYEEDFVKAAGSVAEYVGGYLARGGCG